MKTTRNFCHQILILLLPERVVHIPEGGGRGKAWEGERRERGRGKNKERIKGGGTKRRKGEEEKIENGGGK